jgi:hypothetical protein
MDAEKPASSTIRKVASERAKVASRVGLAARSTIT